MNARPGRLMALGALRARPPAQGATASLRRPAPGEPA
jgi:hypothetical protein